MISARRRPFHRLAFGLVAGLGVLGSAACTDGATPGGMDEPEPRLASHPASAELWSGQELGFSAWWVHATGDSTRAGVRWTTTEGAIDGQGRFTAPLEAGLVLVVARDEMGGGRADTSRVTVRRIDPTEPAEVVIAPTGTPTPTVEEGALLRLVVRVANAAGALLDAVDVEWRSLAPQVATVDTGGVVTAHAPGRADVEARIVARGLADTISVEVARAATASVVLAPAALELPVGAEQLVVATAFGSVGQPLLDRAPAWASDAPGIARVDSAGLVGARAVGTTRVTATVEGVTGAATISVVDTVTAVASVEIAPTGATLVVGDTVRFGATARAASGLALPGAPIAWQSSNPSVATVDAQGLVTATGTGQTQLSASSGGVQGTANVVVQALPPVPVALVRIEPDSVEVATGSEVALVARLYSASGTTLSGRPVTWSSGNAAVATVSALGTVTGGAPGATVVRALAEGVAGEARVIVSDTTTVVGTVQVTPDSSVIDLGGATSLTAEVLAPDGAVLPSVPVAWTSGDTSVASVDANGTVTTRGIGSTGILATAGGVVGVGFVNVLDTATVPGSVTLSAASLALEVGASAPLTATVRDTAGQVVAGFPVIWSSLDSGIASVDAGGLVSGTGAGTVLVRATAGSVTADAVVTVTQPSSGSLANECQSPGAGWIWCDDFDQDRLSAYFEVDDAGGSFQRTSGVGAEGSTGMRAQFAPGQVGAGALHLALGRTPSSYIRPADAGTADYRELYWRVYLRMPPGWVGGGGHKLSRAFVFAAPNWAQAMIAHVWSGGPNHSQLILDPVRGTDTAGNLVTTGYNDFANLTWLGAVGSATPLFDTPNLGVWRCIEAHVRLNDAGQSNGLFELWIDDQPEAQRTGMNFLGSFSAYGLNAVFLENYWNGGAPAAQERYLDNFVVSTQRIGC